ncbi:MAG: biopolymer transporter ExbD [Sphingomicrobium sp.]
MSELNTTPLIDVLLVLIVMLIITVPSQTHKVAIDLPAGPSRIIVEPIRNTLSVDAAGMARWNGTAASDAELRALLAQAARIVPSPELHFIPDEDARYARVDALLALAKRAEVRRMGFVGNERYARF